MSSPRRVVVCGAGVMGASVAYFLARRGVAVTVVERTGVACAASGKSGGFLALDWCDGTPLGPLARASFALHAELARELETDYGYRRMDTFMVAASERGAGAGGHRVGAAASRRAWAEGLQRDPHRLRRACARALRRLPDGRRPRARAGDLSPARRRDLRLRDG